MPRVLVSELLAVSTAGIVVGALTFVSTVSAPTLSTLVREKDAKTITRVFDVWWPLGKATMVPLSCAALGTHVYAFVESKRKPYALGGAFIFLILPYTGLVMMKDIKALREKKDAPEQEVLDTTTRFCKLHHARLVMAVVGLALSLSAIYEE